MEVSKQIRLKRTAKQLSQDQLAEAIYASRQTISNWETGKTYPDVQSLILLSEALDTTVEELVQGDMAEMRARALSDSRAMNIYAWIMVGGVALGALFAVGLSLAWQEPSGIGRMSMGNIAAVAVFVPLYAASVGAACAVERIKRRNNVVTYREISEFMEGKTGSQIERRSTDFSRKHPWADMALKATVSAGIALAFFLVAEAIVRHLG